MGIDYDCRVMYGFFIYSEDIREKFFVDDKVTVTKEKRYSEKTGEYLGEVEVKDEEPGYFLFEEKKYPSESDVVQAICKKLKLDFSEDGSYYTDPDEMSFVIGVYAGGSTPKQLDASTHLLLEARKKLKEWGLDVVHPTIIVAECIC